MTVVVIFYVQRRAICENKGKTADCTCDAYNEITTTVIKSFFIFHKASVEFFL